MYDSEFRYRRQTVTGSKANGAAVLGQYPARRSTVEKRRGFGSMSPEKQREIARKGGRAAHQKGTAHEWTKDEARAAGRKGGQTSRGGRGRLVPARVLDDNSARPHASGMESGRAD